MRYDITIAQGETLQRVFAFKQRDGSWLDLSGYTARAQMRGAYAAVAPIVSLSAVVAYNTPRARWELTLSLTATQTASLVPTTPAGIPNVYDVEMVSGATVERVLEGAAHVTPEVTR